MHAERVERNICIRYVWWRQAAFGSKIIEVNKAVFNTLKNYLLIDTILSRDPDMQTQDSSARFFTTKLADQSIG